MVTHETLDMLFDEVEVLYSPKVSVTPTAHGSATQPVRKSATPEHFRGTYAAMADGNVEEARVLEEFFESDVGTYMDSVEAIDIRIAYDPEL